MRFVALCFAVFLLFMSITHANLIVNEIMYDFPGDDDGHEWVEIYNNGTDDINVTNWKFRTDTTDHALNIPPENGGQGTMLIPNGSYAIIAQDAITFLNDYPGYNGTIIDSSWSVFSNSQNETLILKNSTGSVIDNITYQPTAKEGNTTCIINGTFQECMPTPGYANALYVNETNTTEENETGHSGANITCNLSLEITTSKILYDSETINYTLIVNDTDCNYTEHEINITYWAEDLFGNIVKDYTNTTKNITCYKNINRTWTPSDILGSEGYHIKADITDTGCNDTDISNNIFTKTIIFKGSGYPEESSIRITDVNSGNSAGFGEGITVKTEIYKNTTNKYAIYAWVEDSGGTKLSETTTIHIRTKNTLYNFTLPIQLKHNCGGTYADGNHIVVVEGLGLNTTGNLTISGNANDVCYTEYISSGSGGGSCSCPTCEEQTCPVKAPDYEILAYKDEVKVNEEFETKIKLETDSHKNISVYSYVFDGNKILSDGFDGTKWAGTWTANKQEIELNNSIILVLKNKIKRGTSTGTYTLRVRIDDGKKYDMDREIRVVEKSEEEGGATSTITAATGEEETFVNKTEKEEEIITGYAIREKEEKEFKPSPTMITMYMIYIKLLASKAQETQQTQEAQEDKLINNNQTNATDSE